MKEDRRVVKTKKAIKYALAALITDESSPKITITAIAKKADIDRKTFYLHYGSVNDVVREMCQERLNSFLESLKDNNYFNGPPDVEVILTKLNDMLEEDIDIYRAIAKSTEYTFFWDEISRSVKDTFIATHSKTLNISPKNLALCAEYFSSGLISVYSKWLRNEIQMPFEEVVATLVSLNLFGYQQYLKSA